MRRSSRLRGAAALFLIVKGVIGPRLWLFSALRIPIPPLPLRVLLLLTLALILVRLFAGVT